MLNAIKKIPAGTFLVPLILSMVTYTIWPELFLIGGMTQSLFSGQELGFLTALVTFLSGTLIDLKQLGKLIKRQGVLFLAKAVISLALSWLYFTLFGAAGIFGISSVAFVSTITSVNAAIYLLTAQDYGGTEVDAGAFGLFGILSLPVIPTLFYSFIYTTNAGIDWMPILSILIPLFVGLVLGNLDVNIRKMFSPVISALLPILGWNLGQGLNLIEALKAGIPGLILTVIFVILSSYNYVLDKKVLKTNGFYGLSLITVAGLSTSSPAVLATSFPILRPYVSAATSQILLVSIFTTVIVPIFISSLYNKESASEHN